MKKIIVLLLFICSIAYGQGEVIIQPQLWKLNLITNQLEPINAAWVIGDSLGQKVFWKVDSVNNYLVPVDSRFTLNKSLSGLGNVTNNAQIKKAASSTVNKIPKWNSTAGDELIDGYTAGTAANNLLQLDGSGKVPAGNLNFTIGTAANNVLQLDGSAKVPTANLPAFTNVITAFKAADEIVNNDATAQADDNLNFSVSASSVYQFEIFMKVSTNTTAGLKVTLSAPSGSRFDLSFFSSTTGSTSFLQIGYATTTNPLYIIDGTVAVSSADAFIIIRGTVTTSSTAGTLAVNWAQSVATVFDSKVLRGSYLKAIKVQ